MLQPLVTYPDPRLRKPTKNVSIEELSSEKIQQLAIDLQDTCDVHYGLGLAANQIGSDKNIIVVRPRGVGAENPDPSDYKNDFWVLVNPTFTSVDKTTEKWLEGCLSFPDLEINVERYETIKLTWTNLEGKSRVETIGWPLSGVLQHEIEHLSGHNMAQGKKRTTRAIILGDYRKKLMKKARKSRNESL